MGKIIYLTGAPATGKSTLTRNLSEKADQVMVFTYSKELARIVSSRVGDIDQKDLREQSAKLITRDDVEAVDVELVQLAHRFKNQNGFLVIDSHPVTIESFGFRVTPFTKEMLRQLAPDVITCLYADAHTLANRIQADAAGRPLPTKTELERHVDLQCNLASAYAFETGASLYYLDAARSEGELLENFMQVSRIPRSIYSDSGS
jgi:adenylate kinase